MRMTFAYKKTTRCVSCDIREQHFVKNNMSFIIKYRFT